MDNLFSANLRALRKEKGLKQSELGLSLKLTQRKISYLESGKIEPSLSDLCLIADFFDVSVDFLLGRTDY